ncbi:MAG: hypothetical protein HY917_03565 [Candidatus Diapherotrites archaeon]|nr:hypothetical protein [Candidatus Diapherotrites archaeon]
MTRWFPRIIVGLVVALFAFYYFVWMGRPLGLNYLNAVLAFSSVFVIGYSFLLGPLARFIPFFTHFLSDRKAFGLMGFSLAATHIFLSGLVLLSHARTITLADAVSIAVAALAFMIFTLMAVTSTQAREEKLGYANWKSLQRTGYLAFAMVLLHVALLEQGIFFSRLTGQLAIGFILLVLLLRAIAGVLEKPAPSV